MDMLPHIGFATRQLAHRTVDSASALVDSDRVAVSRMGVSGHCFYV